MLVCLFVCLFVAAVRLKCRPDRADRAGYNQLRNDRLDNAGRAMYP